MRRFITIETGIRQSSHNLKYKADLSIKGVRQTRMFDNIEDARTYRNSRVFLQPENMYRYKRTHKQNVTRSYTEYKKRARKKSLTFSLTKEMFNSIVLSDCYYCGANDVDGIGIDRANNNNGYTVLNSVPCCSTCNYMKHTKDKGGFIKQVLKISKHLTS
jgi:hypothetical protein